MKTLYDKTGKEEVLTRIEKLNPNTERKWGKMNVSQMLLHCSKGMETAIGLKTYKRSFMGIVLGGIFKKMSLGEKPFPKGGPTDPNFVIEGTPNFDEEKKRLVNYINQFADGGEAKCTTNTHSFFGKMTPWEWSRLMYKHLDHHLNQFGV